jgi:DNA-binding Lrp family transcriptional regulator
MCGEEINMPYIDELDKNIIRSLQINARQTNRELAATAKIAPSTSLERVRSLQRRDIIDGYHADVNLRSIGRATQALISVRIKPPSRKTFEAFREWLIDQPEVIGLFVISGSSDILIHVAVTDTDALYAFVIDGLTQRSEVSDIQTSIVYEHVRKHVVAPIN